MSRVNRARSFIAGCLAVLFLTGTFVGTFTANADGGDEKKEGISKVDPMVYHFDFLSTPSDGTVYDKPVTSGWTVLGGANQTTSVENSDWIVRVEDSEFSVQGEANAAIEAALYPTFRMNLLNTSAAVTATLYYTTDKDSVFNESKSLTLPIQPRDVMYREYLFDMSDAPAWSGTIEQVRIVFANEPGDGASDGEARIDYFSFNPDAVPANVIFDFSKNKESVGQFTNAKQAGESLIELVPTGANAGFETAGKLSLDASQFSYLKISLQNATSAKRLRVSFITSTSRVWSEDKSVLHEALKVSDSGQSLYAFNMTSCPLWRGRIEQIRLTFEDTKANDGSIAIPLMGLFTGEVLDDVVIDFTKGHSGWTAGSNTALSQADGAMKVELKGADGSYTSPDLSINADEMRIIRLTLRNDTASTGMRIQWMNEGDSGFTDLKSQNILIKPHAGMQEYVFPLGDHQRWEGTVTRLKITPALYAAGGSVLVKSMAFSQSGDVSFSGRDVTEGQIENSKSTNGSYYINGWVKNQNGGQIAGLDDKGGVFGPSTAGVGGTVEAVNNGPDNTMGKGLPVEAWRSVPVFDDGYIQWPIAVNTNNIASKGNSVRLINTETGNDVIRLTFDEGAAVAALPDGQRKIADLQQDVTLYVTLYMNMAAHTYDLWQGTKRLAEDIPFTSAESFDRIYVGTTGESKVIFSYTGSMYRVNELYEDFSHFPIAAVDSDRYETSGTVKVGDNNGGLETSMPPAFRGGRVLSLSGANAMFKGSFVPGSNVVETNLSFAVMTKADGMKIQVLDGDQAAAAIQIKGDDIVYLDEDGQWQVLWKDFKVGVHYSLKMRAYLELNKIELSINGSSSKDGGRENVNTPVTVPLQTGTDTVDAVSVSTDDGGLLYVNNIRVLDYTPSTVPTVEAVNDLENGYIGVNGWVSNQSSENFYQKSQRIADKESVLGYIDDYNKTALDWQIKYMAENGIDFISYFFIGFGEQAVDTYMDYADYKNLVRFAYSLDYYAASSSTDFENVVYPILAERFFRNPNYIKYENQPILFAYSNDIAHWTADTAKKLKELAKADGFDGLILVNNVNSDDPETAFADSLSKGFDYTTQYWKITSPEQAQKYYDAGKKVGIDYILSPGVGADSRCWGVIEQTPSAYPFIHVTPAEFYNTLVKSKEIMTRYGGDSLASKMIFAENWGELGEGHSILPFGEFGFGYINQIRRVFGSAADNNHKNTRPSGKLDLLFPKGWNSEQLVNRGFESGVANWKADGATLTAVDSKEFYYMKGAADVTARADKASGIRQDVTGQILLNGKGAVYDMSAYVMATSQTYKAPDDSKRYFSFFPTNDKTMALTYRFSGGQDMLTTAPYDEADENQKFIVRKAADGFYQIYLAAGYQENEKGQAVAGKQVVSVDDYPPDGSDRLQFLMASVYVWNVENVNEDNVGCTYFRFPTDVYDQDTIAIRGGINHEERTVLINKGAGQQVSLVIDWSGAEQRWVAKYREPSAIPKSFSTPSSVTLEITDSAGTHRYTYAGASQLFKSVINGGQIRVDWTGQLKKAVFLVNGDTATTEPFLVDECRLQLVPKQYYTQPAYTFVGGSKVVDNGPDPGSEEEAGIIEDILANKDGSIDIQLSKPIVLSRDVFRTAKENNVKVTFSLVDDTRLWYSWTFLPEDIVRLDVDLNTRISYTTPYKATIDKAADGGSPFYLSFAHQGALPGKATIKTYVGDTYTAGTAVSLYDYQVSGRRFALAGEGLITDKDGYVTFAIDTSSEYFLSTERPNPPTGGAGNVVLALLSAGCGMACLALFRRRRTI